MEVAVEVEDDLDTIDLKILLEIEQNDFKVEKKVVVDDITLKDIIYFDVN